MEQVTFRATYTDWQRAAREALRREIDPAAIVWTELSAAQPALDIFDELAPTGARSPQSLHRVPRRFVDLAQLIALHRDSRRWGLLYRLVWRLTHGEPHLLEVAVDLDVALASQFQKAVRHDIHKMRAFVRFREIAVGEGKWFIAWFEPEHHIVEHNAAFFVDRFASMRWSILTPDRSAHWNGHDLTFTDGVDKSQAPRHDNVEALWLTYYANIFNPARVKVHAMEAEMPKKYWRNLPEATLIPSLLEEAPHRVDGMIRRSAQKAAADRDEADWHPAPVPDTNSLTEVATAARSCTACHLYKLGTQTVFGEGP